MGAAGTEYIYVEICALPDGGNLCRSGRRTFPQESFLAMSL